ncbi:MAG: AsmA-like C-terminal region-containing protein, partial [Rikenellaceae bacterium]
VGKFCVDIDNYTASISDSLTLSNFTGLLNVEGSTISLNNFKGNLGKSQATLNTQITIKNRENSEVFEKVNIAADFTTSHVSLKELNVAGLAVVLDDVRSKFSVEIIPDASHETERLESYIVNFDSFSALIGGKPFSQNSVIEKHGNMLKIIKSQLEYDSQTAKITGSLYLGDKGKRDTLNIVTDNLDFKTFAGTNNAGRITLPIAKVPIVVDLTLGKFQLLNQDLTNLRGVISIESNKTLLFKNIRCGVAGGNVNFSGEFTQNLNNYEIKSDITYSNIDLKDLEIKYKISKKDKERYINENLRGKISGTAKANIFADGDRNIDVARSVINANFTIINGQLVDFAPIKAASKYFKRNDLNDIRFDTLSNQITVKSGVISIPRMNIASTLGNYFVSGTTSITDGNMDFMLEVPWNVIGGVVASRIFGGKPKDDDVIESEIKKRYVKFNITGTPETFDVKLRNK